MLKLILFICLLSPVFAAIETDCQELIQGHCPDEKKRMVCVYENYEKATTVCKEALDRASGVAKTSGVRGGGGLNAFGPVAGALGLMGVNKTVVRFSGAYAPEPNPAAITQTAVGLSTPLHSGPTKNLALHVSAARTDFGHRPNLQGTKVNSTWDRVDVGGVFTKRLGEGRSWGARLSVGSASDKTFATKNEATATVSGFYLKPGKANDYWAYTLFLSNNSPILNYIPIPGFIYFHRTGNLTGMYGLPFMNVQWAPVEPWIFSFSLILVNATAEVAHGQRNEFQVFGGFSTQQHSYLRADRDNVRDRFFYHEKKLYVGSRVPLFRAFMGEIQAGESFDRTVSEGKRYNDAKREAHFARSLYVSTSLTLMF
jgi:hypothetical protein